MIVVKIDLDKIPKNAIFKGQKGSYVNIVVNENKDGKNQYGQTHHAYLSQSKEDREAKVDKIYVGNGTEYNFGANPAHDYDNVGDMPF